jgi:carboxylate-amine ligase
LQERKTKATFVPRNRLKAGKPSATAQSLPDFIFNHFFGVTMLVSEQRTVNGVTSVPSPEEMVFQGSPGTTLGVELELQILDQESGDLAPGAVPLLEACRQEKVAGVAAELMQSMIEVKTGICANVAAVRDELLPRLKKVNNLANSLGYALAMAGTHPFHRTSGSVIFPGERYERIADRLALLTYQRVVFGLHVHVGVPSGDRAIGVINQLVQYLPHLLALSANSPFWQGMDTGLHSCRTAWYRLLPHAGVPRYFGKWKEFRSFCQVMKDCNAIKSFKDIYWDIRPRPDFGTLEFRICDMPASLTVVWALVALIRCLVINSLRLLEEKPFTQRGDMRRHWIAVENKWLATRYGLGASYIRTPSGKRRQLGQELADLIQRLMPIAREHGDHPFLQVLGNIDKFEGGAARQRRLFRQEGHWQAIISDLKLQWAKDLASGEWRTASGERSSLAIRQ